MNTTEEFFVQILSGARIFTICVTARTFHEANSTPTIHTNEFMGPETRAYEHAPEALLVSAEVGAARP